MGFLNKIIWQLLGYNLVRKYIKTIQGNRKWYNQVVAIVFFSIEKRYAFNFKLFKQYHLYVHTMSWNKEDLFKRLIILIGTPGNNQVNPKFYIKKLWY